MKIDPSIDIPEVESVKRLHLEPGDVIVIKSQDPISIEATKHIKETMDKLFPNVPVIILDRGLDIEVLRQERKIPIA